MLREKASNASPFFLVLSLDFRRSHAYRGPWEIGNCAYDNWEVEALHKTPHTPRVQRFISSFLCFGNSTRGVELGHLPMETGLWIK